MKETINQRIYRFRKNLGYTQSYMAEILDMHITTYSRLERKGNISCKLLVKLAEIFKTDISTILYGEINGKPQEETPKNQNLSYDFDSQPFFAIDHYEKGTLIAMRSVSSENKIDIFRYAINKLEEQYKKSRL